MNINMLLLLLGVVLGSIFLFFKPLHIVVAKSNKEIPQAELRNYTLYELDTTKMIDLMQGSEALYFKNKEILKDFVFIDNSHKELMTLSAKEGQSKHFLIELQKDVRYTKGEGFELKTQHLLYDRKKGIVWNDVAFVVEMNGSVFQGSKLYYDLNKRIFKAKNVEIIYKVEGAL